MAALPSGLSLSIDPPGYAMTDTAHTQLTTFTQALQAFERGDHTAATLSTLARQQTTLLAALPPRYSDCLLYTSPSPRDQRGSRMPSSA